MKNSGHYFEAQERKMKRRFFGLDNLSDRERSHMADFFFDFVCPIATLF